MKPRLLFFAVICVLLYGWYQMRILPYGSTSDRQTTETSTERQRAMLVKDSSLHATGQAIPGVW